MSPIDFSKHQQNALEKHTPGTCEAFLEAPEFRNWEETEHGSILWCPGAPGGGKSTFAAYAIHRLQQQSAVVCYIYRRYYAQFTVLELFKALLRQLILRCPHANIEEVQKKKEQDSPLSLEEVVSLLQAIFRFLPGKIFVVIDALDECFDEETRHHLLQLLHTFTFAKVLITSRPLPSIERVMQGIPRLIIRATAKDIRTHFQARKQRNPTLNDLILRLSGIDIDAKVVERADGMFLLADLHISNLAGQTNLKALICALDTLPTEARATYAHALDRIDGLSEPLRQLAYITLSLVSFAERPLTVTELRHAIANVRLDEIADEDDLDEESLILSVCAGLLIVDKQSDEVVFLHYTVQEYIEQVREGPNFVPQIRIAKSFMKIIPIPVVSLRPPSHPLIQYSALVWGPLVQKAEHDDSVRDMALSQLESEAHVAIIHPLTFRIPGGRFHYFAEPEVFAPHLIAIFGLESVGKAFFQMHPTSIHQSDRRGRTPLS